VRERGGGVGVEREQLFGDEHGDGEERASST
jgi:hypothetical protein